MHVIDLWMQWWTSVCVYVWREGGEGGGGGTHGIQYHREFGKQSQACTLGKRSVRGSLVETIAR